VRLDPSPKLAGLGTADVSFAAGIGDCLPEQAGPAAGRQKVRYRLADRCEWKPFLNCDVVLCEIVAVHDNVFWFLPSQPRGFGDREVNQARVGVGDSVHGERRCVRNCDTVGASVRLRPKHSFSVLREPARRKMGNPVDSSGDSLDSFSLEEPGQNRICETCRAGLLGGDQSIVLFCEGYQFFKTRARHSLVLPFLAIGALSISFHSGTILTSAAEGDHQAKIEQRALSRYPPFTLHQQACRNRLSFHWRFPYPESTPCASMLFKTNDGPTSQAGRRRFESGLPLQNQQLTDTRFQPLAPFAPELLN
jgi:hypothetical protein